MSSTFDDSVLDFDLNLFQQSSNNAVGQNHKDKVRKAILLSKRKMLSTDSLIRKYYDKRLSYRALERCLVSAKEEYKQACIENMEYREKYSSLEDEIKKMESANNALEQKCLAAHNQHDGMQSHAKQLQQLVKEKETVIESLKIEHQLEKANFKEIEKNNIILQKENEHLIKNICFVRDIVLGKKTLTKELRIFLIKYGKKGADDTYDAEEMCDDVDTYDDPLSPSVQHGSPDPELCNDGLGLTLTLRNVEENKNVTGSELRNIDINEGNIHTTDENDHDSECSNEVVSLDTGRGSSLAFSDSDKCFNSPEYFAHHSPLNSEVLRTKDKVTVNVSTSPLPIREVTDIGTSPIIFENPDIIDGIAKIVSDGIEPIDCNYNGERKNTPIIMIDRVLSPMFATHSVEISTSPLKNQMNDAATSPLKLNIVTSNRNNNEGDNTQEDFLEINNSCCIEDENSNDCEIQMIFDSMRFSQKLITPIPTTPAKSRSVETSTNAVTQTTHASVCPEAAKLREDNISLQATVAKLANDIQNINEFIMRLSPLIANDKYAGAGRTPVILGGDCATRPTVLDRQVEDEVIVENNIASTKMTGPIEENAIRGKSSKLQKLNNILFADASPPRPSDAAPPTPAPQPARTGTAPAPQPARTGTAPAPQPARTGTAPAPQPTRTGTAPAPQPERNGTAPASQLARTGTAPAPPQPARTGTAPAPQAECNDSAPAPQPARTGPAPALQPERTGAHAPAATLKAKQRLHFEDPIRIRESVEDEASSDCEVYEREIVIELAPDSLESDTSSIHEMLKEQISRRQNLHEARDRRTPGVKKSTKLQKLRKKMIPKSKIKKVDKQVRMKKRIQPKRLTTGGDRILDTLISNKAAYEKACKVMSELKSKEKVRKNDDNAIVVLPRLSLSPEKGAQKVFKCSELTDMFTSNNNSNLQEPSIQIQNQSIVQNDLSSATSVKYDISATKMSKEIVDKSKFTSEMVHTSENSHVLGKNSDLLGKRILRTRSQSISNNTSTPQKPEICSDSAQPPLSSKMYVRNRRKSKVEDSVNHDNNNTIVSGLIKSNTATVTEEAKSDIVDVSLTSRKTLKRQSVDKPDLAPKRMLRSSVVLNNSTDPQSVLENKEEIFSKPAKEIVSYGDIDIFEETENHSPTTNKLVVQSAKNYTANRAEHPKFGVLCNFIDKYGRKSPKIRASKLTENIINIAYKKIEDGIGEIQKLPPKDCKLAMDELVQNLQGLKQKQILAGVIKFLKEPARKIELYNKFNVPPAPPMTKAEQILIYLVSQLKVDWPDIVENILRNIEYSLFMLNRTPEFDVIETLAHFYAVLCRYDKNRNRLRVFIIDAMYCLQYKAVPLIKQCLEVWMHILPLAHMGIAKNPLVTCLVYLLHFYKCEDKFNRVQEIRNILHRKYFYEVTEWNEPRILEMFKNSILELSDITIEKKMLKMALIVLAKRHGARWCQNNIIKNMLQPIIEQPQVPDRIKQFCVSLLGPLLKPYPMDMKVNCEIVMNQLCDMLSRNPSEQMVEAIFTSLIYMSRHNQNRVIKALLFWKTERISPELEDLLKNYVKERPLKSWRIVLSKISIHQNA